MSMKRLKDGVENLIDQEYRQSSEKYGKKFASYHEAYGVIKEEIEEAQVELDTIYKGFNSFWDGVKHDIIPINELKYLARHACLAACELIQVATMAHKATLGLKRESEDLKSQEDEA